jgi:hypothetical protein
VVEANGVLSTFQVVDPTNEQRAFEGILTEVSGFSEWGGGPSYYVADFSALRQSGIYELRSRGTASAPFAIADRLLFNSTARAIIEYFRAMRADESDAAIWSADETVSFVDRPGTRDVRGGWYDASGDVSKYLTHLSYANFLNPQQIPLVVWALGWVYDNAPPLTETRGLLPELQAEALWGADFLVRMQDEAGFFYATVFDGWSGSPGKRQITAFSGMDGKLNPHYQAAFREGGGMAIAALARAAHWKKDSKYFSAARYLESAERGFRHLTEHNLEYVDDGKENIIDDYAALLAASELFATTDQASYLEAARARAQQLLHRLHAAGYFVADGATRPFWHASDAGLPVVALVRYLEVETDAAAKDAALAGIRKHLTHLVAVTSAVPNPYLYARQQITAQRSAFFIPHQNESGYWWQGENARLASITTAALLGGAVASPAPEEPLGLPRDLSQLAIAQLDWVLGKNPYDVCMLAGFGRNNPPPYPLSKPEGGTVVGGIANGITGREGDGPAIQWDLNAGRDSWKRWRWVEQWLPHTAWYLVSITALAKAEP